MNRASDKLVTIHPILDDDDDDEDDDEDDNESYEADCLTPFIVSDVKEREGSIPYASNLSEDELVREFVEGTDRFRFGHHDRYRQHGAFVDPEDDVLEVYLSRGDVGLYPLRSDVNLWMVTTNSGSEAAAFFKILAAGMDNKGSVISVSTLPHCPARVFVESWDPHGVWQLCLRIPEILKMNGITLIHVNDRVVLFSGDRLIQVKTCVRLRGGTNKGDLAYVLHVDENSDHVQIAVVPRMPFTVPRHPEDNLRKRKRKLQRLNPVPFDPVVIQDVHGPDALERKGDAYIFEHKTFLHGMLILNLQSLHTLDRIPFPSLKELKPFVDAGFISHDTALMMTWHEELPRLRPGDSVLILEGNQAGCRALVVTIEDYVACLDIDPVDVGPRVPFHLVNVPIHHMQHILRIGDHVRVREDAENLAGRSGSVIAISEDRNAVHFIDDKTRDPICIHARCVETYMPNLFPADLADVPPETLSTRNDPLVGRRVLVCGRNTFKGYIGNVRSIAEGIINVYLDANRRIEPFQLRDLLDFGRTLDGRLIPVDWRPAFARALRNHIRGLNPRPRTPPPENTVFRHLTPPPDLPRELCAPTPIEAAWAVDQEDLADNRRPYDGPGKWLLDQRIQALFATKSLAVRFRTEYDDGRWDKRTAKTSKTQFVTESVLPHEIALELTNQRGKPITKHVDVGFLLPAKPLTNNSVIIIDGPNIGDVGTVLGKSRTTQNYTIQLLGSAAKVFLPNDVLCRLWDE